MKPNIIKLLIITNVVIFLISTSIIFFRITTPKTPTIITSKKPASTEQKVITDMPPLTEKKENVPSTTENVSQKDGKIINQETTPLKNKNLQQQKQNKIVEPTSSLVKTEIATTAGYMEKEVPSVRNIKFTFFSRKAKKVSIIGDFNDWVPQSLIKVAENRWEITLKIPAGQDYLYNFLVDGKVTIDPNNKKPPQISPQGFKSSVLSL